ncbi:MAG: response regulator [bacterium]|nr:response regulator [bacterium]
MPKKILVADSSITIQKVFSFTFKAPDYVITSAGDATMALAKAKETIPDLIVADLSLPQKNGYELFQEIRKNPQLQKVIGLILVSANETFNPEKARPVGVSDFLVKPFDTQALTNKVKEMLSRPPKTVAPVTSARDLPPLSMQDEPSLIRFTRSTLSEKPKAPEPAPAVSDKIQVVDQDLEPETVDFAEVESLEPEADLEPVAGAELEAEPELVSLDQVELEPAELGEEKPAGPDAEEQELEEIVLDDELGQVEELASNELEPMELEPVELEPMELEPMELEPMELEPLEPAHEGGSDEIEFDVVEDSSASHFEAKPKKPAGPAAPDLSALDDLPMAEAEEVEELPEMEEIAPMEELAPEAAPAVLEEVPPEIPYAEAVEEELSREDEPPAGGETGAEPMELEMEPETAMDMEEAQLQELAEETPAPEAGEKELELEPLAMESEPEAAPDEEGLPGAVPTDLKDQMPEEEFIAVDYPEPQDAAPAPQAAEPRIPVTREADMENVNRLAAETFEKVAWEVIPDLVDRLVREMVRERIEKVAWEVVPDLAERLIQEEIRKLEAQAGKE